MRAWLAVALAGCSFSSKTAPGMPVDAGDDVEIDGPPVTDASLLDAKAEAVCVGSFVKVCVDPPSNRLQLATQKIDTTSSPMCAAYNGTTLSLCVVSAQSIELAEGATLTVSGNRPLVLLSTSTITIDGTIDAASHRTRDRDVLGPGADMGPCGVNAKESTQGFQGGGGYGGSFGGPGGNGGNAPSAFGGIAAPAPNIVTLSGGCRGGNGADNIFDMGRGTGGHGGGAVLLLAPQTITVGDKATINASGEGGQGGRGQFSSQGAGGGGGGAGGMIAFDATTVTIDGKCFANGGGGGEGSERSSGRDGGESTAPDNKAPAGGGGSSGGDGGDGALGSDGPQNGSNGAASSQTTGGGGGGAGGSVGVIKIVAATKNLNGDLSPAAR